MNRKELVQQWIEALQSGEYRQGEARLTQDAVDRPGFVYCCLGVLCDIHPEVKLERTEPNGPVYLYDYKGVSSGEALPRTLREEVGLTKVQQEILIELNDTHGSPFDEIARWIEENLLVEEETDG